MINKASFSGVSDAAWASATAPGGYAWWYFDAVGRGGDGESYALTIILFAGAVFSPGYAARARAGCADNGLMHPAVNLALHHVGAHGGGQSLAWAMNVYPAAALQRSADGIAVGASSLRYHPDGSVLVTLQEEQTEFGPRPGPLVTGTLHLIPQVAPLAPQVIGRSRDGKQTHHWQPLAARGQVRVDLQVAGRPLAFRGTAYHDSNYGDGRLEQTFARWFWTHAAPPGGSDELILYRTDQLDGGGRSLAVRISPDGAHVEATDRPFAEERSGGPRAGRFLWMRVPSCIRAGAYRSARHPGSRLVDAPFYARFETRVSRDGDSGPACAGIGEYLDLRRFRSRVVQFMLGYKTRQMLTLPLPSPQETS